MNNLKKLVLCNVQITKDTLEYVRNNNKKIKEISDTLNKVKIN